MILNLLILHVIACNVRLKYIRLPQFHLMELHYKIVILSAQVGVEGTYGHVLVHGWYLYVFEVVLLIFEKG